MSRSSSIQSPPLDDARSQNGVTVLGDRVLEHSEYQGKIQFVDWPENDGATDWPWGERVKIDEEWSTRNTAEKCRELLRERLWLRLLYEGVEEERQQMAFKTECESDGSMMVYCCARGI